MKKKTQKDAMIWKASKEGECFKNKEVARGGMCCGDSGIYKLMSSECRPAVAAHGGGKCRSQDASSLTPRFIPLALVEHLLGYRHRIFLTRPSLFMMVVVNTVGKVENKQANQYVLIILQESPNKL